MDIEVFANNSELPYIVDEEGYELFLKHIWFATSGDYKYLRTKVVKDRKIVVIKFHIELMKNEILKELISGDKKIIVDHINGNVNDNRKVNLRVRTQSENNMNKKIQKNNSSGIVGVSWNSHDKLWNSNISLNNNRIYLGSFYYFRNAVRARMEAEDKYFKEHAYRLRDSAYSELLNTILNMDDVIEPIFTPKRGNYEVNGISKFREKFRARIVFEKREYSSVHDDISSAISWRRESEIELYGQELKFISEKEERQI